MQLLEEHCSRSPRSMAALLAGPPFADARELESQFRSLQEDIRHRAHFKHVAGETFRQESLILAGDRDPADVVLRRTAALLADLKTNFGGHQPCGPGKGTGRPASRRRSVDVKDAERRFALFADACRVRRQIALRNPLLGFDKILFIKRHRALYDHMCDQYYGMAATPGGGLYVLSGAFGPNPAGPRRAGRCGGRARTAQGPEALRRPEHAARRLLRRHGQRHGQDNGGGSFLSPDLSYDGKSVLFAYVECNGDSGTATTPTRRRATGPRAAATTSSR